VIFFIFYPRIVYAPPGWELIAYMFSIAQLKVLSNNILSLIKIYLKLTGRIKGDKI
jgi:hypothetical protein